MIRIERILSVSLNLVPEFMSESLEAENCKQTSPLTSPSSVSGSAMGAYVREQIKSGKSEPQFTCMKRQHTDRLKTFLLFSHTTSCFNTQTRVEPKT